MTSKLTLPRVFISTILAMLLTACGGGGGSGSPVANDFSISGTAATGTAISSGTVEAKCKSGTGTATTNYDGTFTIDISSGSLPCMLKATDPVSNLTLHSVVETGATTTNISPATELVTANLLGNTPALVFADFTNSVQEKITTTNIATAVATFQAATTVLGMAPTLASITWTLQRRGSSTLNTTLQKAYSSDRQVAGLSALASQRAMRTILTGVPPYVCLVNSPIHSKKSKDQASGSFHAETLLPSRCPSPEGLATSKVLHVNLGALLESSCWM